MERLTWRNLKARTQDKYYPTFPKKDELIISTPEFLKDDELINSIPDFPKDNAIINVLVITLYKLKKSGLVGDTDVYDKYKYCFDKCIQSYLSNNPNLFDKVIILENNENAQNNMEMEYQVLKKLKKIWFTSKCNVLFAEIDTICFGKLDSIFKLDKFTMFAGGSARDNELNSGILFFPRTMDINVWNLLDKLIKNYDFTKHAYFQGIADKMFRYQFKTEFDAYQYINNIGFGKYNYFIGLRNPYGSTISEENAVIKHYFSSRGIDNLIIKYKEFDELTIKFDYSTL